MQSRWDALFLLAIKAVNMVTKALSVVANAESHVGAAFTMVSSRPTAATQNSQVATRRPIHGRWDRLFLYARTKPEPGIHVAAPEFDAELHIETTTVMFADVVESVRLIEHDEKGNVLRIRALLKEIADEIVSSHHGYVLERRGDGLLIRFLNARDASNCALSMHQFCMKSAARVPEMDSVVLRIGIHDGRFLVDESGVYGRNMSVAARVAGLASPGQTLVTASVRDELVDDIDCSVEDQGECYLKHLDRSVRIYRIDVATDLRKALEPDQTNLRPTVAIIPPKPLTNGVSDSLNAEVFADCLIALLSRTPELRLLSRLTTRVFQHREPSLADQRQQLGADYCLNGTARFSGTKIVVLLQLSETATGEVVWSDQVKGETESLLDSESELIGGVSQKIVRAIVNAQVRLSCVAKVPNLKSYSLLLAGVGLLHRQQLADFDRARSLFEALSERHPRHSAPYAWQAAWRVFRVTQGWFDNLDQERTIAHDFARRAVDVDPDDALGHTVSGLVATNLRRDFSDAEISFETALLKNDNEPLAWLHRGALRAFLGDGRQAMIDTARARSLSPLDPWNYYFETLSASAAFAASDYEEARRLAMLSMKKNRLHLSTLRVLAMANAELGDTVEAAKYLGAVLAIDPALTISSYLSRSPSAGRAMAETCASALRKAGLPE